MKTIAIKTKLPENMYAELEKAAELQDISMDRLFEDMARHYINFFDKTTNDPIGEEFETLILEYLGLPPEEPSNVIRLAETRRRTTYTEVRQYD